MHEGEIPPRHKRHLELLEGSSVRHPQTFERTCQGRGGQCCHTDGDRIRVALQPTNEPKNRLENPESAARGASSYEASDALEMARIRLHLERQLKPAQPIGNMDLLIASTARARGLIRVTDNTAEFSRVPNLRLENWR